MPRRFRGEPPTRFAQLLMNYMWSQRPPLDQTGLARQLDVSHNAVHGWLVGGKLPRNTHEMVPKIAAATGISQAALYEALGYRLGSPAPLSAPPRVIEVDRFGDLIGDLRLDSRLSDAQKWHAIRAAYEGHHGISRPQQWIEAEHTDADDTSDTNNTGSISTSAETNTPRESARTADATG